MAPLKDLKKLRKEFEEKMEKTMELKGDMSAVHGQLRSLGKAFDTLSQIMVDEMDSICADAGRTKADTAEQLTTLAKAMQTFTPEMASLRSFAENCRTSADQANSSNHKLKRWTEAGFKRLSEAMSVQQQALTVLDTQVSSMSKQVEESRGETAAARQENKESTRQQTLLRNHLTEVISNHERMMKECQDQMRQMQAAVSKYDVALSDREAWSGMQVQDISRVETQVHELRAMVETRLAAVEKSSKSANSLAHSKSSSAAERRIAELEGELGQARRQLGEQDSKIRELQLQVQSCSERCLFSAPADRQHLDDAVSRAVQDYLRRHPPPRTEPEAQSAWKSTSGVSSVHPRNDTTVAGSPQRYTTPTRRGLGIGGSSALESSALGPGRPHPGTLERVMEESQRRLDSMRLESEQRHSALSRAVEEIDFRIRQSAQ